MEERITQLLNQFKRNPVVALLMLTVGAGGAWWVKSALSESQVVSLEERLALSQERLSVATEENERLQRESELIEARREIARLTAVAPLFKRFGSQVTLYKSFTLQKAGDLVAIDICGDRPCYQVTVIDTLETGPFKYVCLGFGGAEIQKLMRGGVPVVNSILAMEHTVPGGFVVFPAGPGGDNFPIPVRLPLQVGCSIDVRFPSTDFAFVIEDDAAMSTRVGVIKGPGTGKPGGALLRTPGPECAEPPLIEARPSGHLCLPK